MSVDVIVATVLTCLDHSEKRKIHREKVNPNNFTCLVSKAVNKLSGHNFRFVRICEPEKLVLMYKNSERNSKEDRKLKVPPPLRQATRVVWDPSSHHIFITVQSDFFKAYVEKEVENIYDCYTAKVPEDLETVAIMLKAFKVIKMQIRSSVGS